MPEEFLQFRQPQAQRLARFGVTASVDMHCHCLPGLDDGPQTTDDAIAICRALVADGITTVLATPHQLGPFEGVTASEIRRLVKELQARLDDAQLPLTVRPGGEVRCDERVLQLLDADELLTLGDGGAYLLLELPHSTLLDLRGLIDALVARGITPVIAHPERHGPLGRSPNLIGPWVARGARLQLTAGSLLGVFGHVAMQASWQLLDAGWVSLIASDAHDAVQRPPSMTAAIELVARHRGHAVARRLCVQNPLAVAEGRPLPKPVVRGIGGRA